MEKIELNGPSMVSAHISGNISLAQSICESWTFFFVSSDYANLI